MSCDELRDLYELYAMGVLEEPERSEIRAHLDRHCDTCVPGVHAARGLVSLIGATAPPAAPPARLRRRVMALTGEPERRWSWAPLWAGVAAAAIVAAVLINLRAGRTAAELAQAQRESATQTNELVRLNEALAILNGPEVREIDFGAGKPQPPKGRVFLSPKRGVLLLASNLPAAPDGKIYEMWLIPKGGKPAPAGLFQSASDGTALHLLSGPLDIAQTGAVAVTLEPAGGVPQPTSTPIIVAAL